VKTPLVAAVALSASLLIGACSKTGALPSASNGTTAPIATAVADGPIDIIAREFSFEIPAIAAGDHQMQLINEGEQAHMVVILRLEDGKNAEDALDYIDTHGVGGRAPSWAFLTAGGFADPGTTAPIGSTDNKGNEGDPSDGVDFIAGDYVALCFIPDGTTGRDQKPEEGAKLHSELGMVSSFTVV
jgi:hypothetical protein